jgi:hypothetical protein
MAETAMAVDMEVGGVISKRSIVRTGLVALAALVGVAGCGGSGGGGDDAAAGANDGVFGSGNDDAGAAADGTGQSSGGEGAGAGTDGPGQGGGGGQGAGGAAGIDLCSLLDPSEVEAQFGEGGAVADGKGGDAACLWEVGDQSRLGLDEGPGQVSLTDVYVADTWPADAQYDNMRDLTEGAIDVDGVGDEAFLVATGSTLVFRSGEAFLSLTASFYPPPAGREDKLVALAQQIASRL